MKLSACEIVESIVWVMFVSIGITISLLGKSSASRIKKLSSSRLREDETLA